MGWMPTNEIREVIARPRNCSEKAQKAQENYSSLDLLSVLRTFAPVRQSSRIDSDFLDAVGVALERFRAHGL
jgi:hypothetical protein